MIALWFCLCAALAADAPTIDLFPPTILEQQALAPSTDPQAPADPVEEEEEEEELPPIRLTPRQREAVERYKSGRRIRTQGLAVGALSVISTLVGVGFVSRGMACRRCAGGLQVPGALAIVAGAVGIEVGAGMTLAGAERERKSLQRLIGRPVPGDGVVLGWTLMGSQVLLPGIGGVAAWGAAARQIAVNDRIYKRLTENEGR
ncbi:MAG: hypothetical protein AB8H79_11505 [Myxococcota bacterium]